MNNERNTETVEFAWDAAVHRRRGEAPGSLPALINAYTFVADGDLTPVRAALQAGNRPLCRACEAPHPELVKLLIDHGADVHQRVELGPAMYNAHMGEGMEGLQDFLLAVMANAESPDKPTETALDAAVGDGAMEMARLLMAHGAVASPQAAILMDDLPALERALANGADVNALDPSGICLLGGAIQHSKPEAAALLLDHGADPNGPCDNGLSCAEAAAAMDYESASDTILNLLHAKGATLTLSAAIALGHTQTVITMLNNGASPTDSTDGFWNQTPLHFAAAWNHPDIATLLIARGADVNAQNMCWATPLSMAKAASADELVEILEAAGAKERARP